MRKLDGTDFTISFDAKGLDEFLMQGTVGAAKKALRQAIRRTSKGVQTNVLKAIRGNKLLDIKGKNIEALRRRRFIFLKDNLGQDGLSLGDFRSEVTVTDKHPYLIEFFGKKIQTGETKLGHPLFGAEVRVFGKKWIIHGGFIQKLAGGLQILARTGQARYPIRKLFGPSLAFQMEALGLIEPIEKAASERLAKEMDHQLDYYLEKELSKK